MRLVILVIPLLFISGGCYHLLIVENLKTEFLYFVSKLAEKVSNNDTLRHDKTLILYEYKPFLDRLKKVEEDVWSDDLLVNIDKGNNKIRSHFTTISKIITQINPNQIFNKNDLINGIKKSNYTNILQNFRKKTMNQSYFYLFLEEIDKKVLEKYSKHELCFMLYQFLTLTDIKGFILTSLFEFITNNYNISSNSPAIIPKYNDILLSLNDVADDIWRQDPAKHKKGETYVEIENFLQGVVVYEEHMFPYDCKKECSYYETTRLKNICRNQFNEMNNDCKWLFHSYMNSELSNCQEPFTTVTTCPDKYPRIYKYLKFGDQRYGDDSTRCTDKEKTFTKKNDCSYCVCTRHHLGESATYISLRAVNSVIAENRIIVGARFQIHNNIIHIQIKEGILGPYLTINETRWVPIENFKRSDRLIFQNQDYIRVSKNKRSIHLAVVKLSHHEYKFINIKNYVLTGVRFKEVQGNLLLQIICTRFDLKSGALDMKNRGAWIDNSGWPHNEIKIDNSDLPRDGGASEIVNTGNDQFVKFTHSSFSSDFAQTTVPFFDAQEVVSSGPLRGIGIYYKRELKRGNRKSGGFLGIKLFTYDYRDHLRKLTN